MWLGGCLKQAGRGKNAPRNEMLLSPLEFEPRPRIVPALAALWTMEIAMLATGSRENRCCPAICTSS